MRAFNLGLDIGYSNLKVAMGDASSPTTKVLPSGAGRVEDLPSRIGGGVADDDVLMVTLDGEKWAAGVDQSRLESTVRELHRDCPSSRAYRALFHAALVLGGTPTVAHLVTGLPVSQALDENFTKGLADRLRGEHQVAGKRTVSVEKVTVLPQPAGAYLDMVQWYADPDSLADARVLVIDPGYYSADWIIIEDGELRKASSGTSQRAMSVVLEQANTAIREDHGGAPGVDRIEQAIRVGAATVLVFGEKVDLASYLEAAADKVAFEALTEMKQVMRQSDRAVDIVLIAGGGAKAYERAAKQIMPRSQTIVPDEPVLANARGFWRYAVV